MLIRLNSIMKLIPESYRSDRSRQKSVSYVLLLPFQKNCLLSWWGFFITILFATSDVFLLIWSPTLYSYSAGNTNRGSSAAIAEQSAPTLLI